MADRAPVLPRANLFLAMLTLLLIELTPSLLFFCSRVAIVLAVRTWW